MFENPEDVARKTQLAYFGATPASLQDDATPNGDASWQTNSRPSDTAHMALEQHKQNKCYSFFFV